MQPPRTTHSFSPPLDQVLGQEPPQPPFVHPSVAASPEALAYAAGVQARRARPPMPKYTDEVPGPPPPMPPLDQPHQEGLTMQQQAGMYGMRADEHVSRAAGPGSIVEGPPVPSFGARPGQGSSGSPIQMQDLLPEEAMQDPSFRKGQGALMAINQPELAMKYGVVRNQQRVPPQALQAATAPGRGRRAIEDTVRDLNAVMTASPPSIPRTNAEAEKQVESLPAGASQNAGAPMSAKERAEVEEALGKMDDFDFEGLRRQMNEDILNNPDQRKIIEARLKPLDLAEMVMHNRVEQEIPIRPGVFWFSFQSLTGDDDLALKRLIMEESKKIEVTERYLLDKYAFMTVTAGLVSVCGRPVPHSHLNVEGEFDDVGFWKKFVWVMKRPLHMLASFGVNHTWFEMRCRRLYVAENVKNG